MTLQQLRYVIQIVESGSFNSAAKALFISQPSLSKSIHDLEEEMSICLFVRTNKGILLSEQGEKFLGYARQVIEQANLLEEQYKNTFPTRTVFLKRRKCFEFRWFVPDAGNVIFPDESGCILKEEGDYHG